jgi:hypothetical protein
MGTPEDYYTSFFANPRDFQQTVTSGYAQATVRLSPKLTMLGGVRMEETQNDVREFDPLTRAQVLAAGYPVNAPGASGGRAARPFVELRGRSALLGRAQIRRE